MDTQDLCSRIREMMLPVLQENCAELVECRIRRAPDGIHVAVLADKTEGSINLDECAHLNRIIGAMLESRNLIDEHFILEVSSPGLDRVLLTRRDFERSAGRKLKFFLSAEVEGRIEWDGIVSSVDDDGVTVDVRGRLLVIPLDKMRMAKQIV